MELFDTHCHIQSAGNSVGERTTGELWSKAPDLTGDQIIENGQAAGVNKMICVGCDINDSQLALDFASSRDNVWASIGIHPHEASKHQAETQKSHFASLLKVGPLTGERNANSKIVAIGECGLDYFYNHSPKEAQLELLKFQIELALDYNLPMIFHVRQAFDDFWPVFESYQGKKGKKIRGVLHSFTDSQENLQRAIKHDLFIGVNGIATFAKADRQQEMYKTIPLQKLLLETDAPFLTPAPYRGTINEVKYVRVTADFLAKLRDEQLSEIARQTTANAKHLFAIK